MLARDAYERLKHAIYTGKLGAGDRIVERDLAKRFHISRIPLRESLARLQGEGLIRSIPYSSTYVEDFETADILEIYSLRLLFEPLATRLVTLNTPSGLVQRLERLCDQMQKLAGLSSPLQLDGVDYRFHHAIVAASGHKRLLRAYEGAHIQVLSLRAGMKNRKSDRDVAEVHRRIVKLISDGNADRAERTARQHVEEAIRLIDRLVSAGQRIPAR